LAKGLHSFRVFWVDQRTGQTQWAYPGSGGFAPSEGEDNLFEKYQMWRGEKPTLEISGPGMAKQPIPAGMLFR
jgi:hypothetical protein